MDSEERGTEEFGERLRRRSAFELRQLSSLRLMVLFILHLGSSVLGVNHLLSDVLDPEHRVAFELAGLEQVLLRPRVQVFVNIRGEQRGVAVR